jgi:hypothetical protein
MRSNSSFLEQSDHSKLSLNLLGNRHPAIILLRAEASFSLLDEGRESMEFVLWRKMVELVCDKAVSDSIAFQTKKAHTKVEEIRMRGLSGLLVCILSIACKDRGISLDAYRSDT